jgi:protein-L-isoaspartate(D-aspartate) O-methyltransferase
LVGPDGVVVGIDHIPDLVSSSVDSLKKDGLGSAIEAQKIIMVDGDGRQGKGYFNIASQCASTKPFFSGYPSHGPYDAIHIGAAAPSLPTLRATLLPQLTAPGRIFTPVGPDGGHQDIYVIDKDVQGNVTCRDVMGVRVSQLLFIMTVIHLEISS